MTNWVAAVRGSGVEGKDSVMDLSAGRFLSQVWHKEGNIVKSPPDKKLLKNLRLFSRGLI